MIGFLNSHGTSAALYGHFLAYYASDDACYDEARGPEYPVVNEHGEDISVFIPIDEVQGPAYIVDTTDDGWLEYQPDHYDELADKYGEDDWDRELLGSWMGVTETGEIVCEDDFERDASWDEYLDSNGHLFHETNQGDMDDLPSREASRRIAQFNDMFAFCCRKGQGRHGRGQLRLRDHRR